MHSTRGKTPIWKAYVVYRSLTYDISEQAKLQKDCGAEGLGRSVCECDSQQCLGQ